MSDVVDHVGIRVSDLDRSRIFYTAALAPLGFRLLYETVAPAAGFRSGRELPGRAQFACVSGSFSVVANGDHPTEHVHLAFAATDDETVERFHREATAAGYRDNGPPGERAVYHEGYYGAFVLDPDGNNVEAVWHAPGQIEPI